MSVPSEAELTDAITKAARKTIRALFDAHPEEHFYYVSLITDGLGNSPFLTAWSKEALDRKVAQHDDPESVRSLLKWSYADSPYDICGEEDFAEVQSLFAERPPLHTGDLSDAAADAEFETRLRSMEAAMVHLDREGLFGKGADRLQIVINAEVMPPDHTNTERALRLNPEEALTDWLKEVAEPADA